MSSPATGAAITFASGPFTHDRSSPSAAALTFTGVGFGTADTHRQVVLAIGGLSADGRVSGVTIAGVAATQIAATTYTSGVQPFISIWAASIPSGASGDVVLTFDAAIYSIGMTAYRLIKSDGFAVYDVVDRPAAKVSSIDLSLMTKASGAFLGVAQAYGSGNHNWTWTPNVEHVDVDIRSGEQYSTGGVSDTVADGVRAQTVDFTTSSNFITGLGVSWDGPAAPEGVTGAASGSFLTSIAAAGAVAIAGFASGGFTASSAATGATAVRGAASTGFTSSAAAAGGTGVQGTASGAFTVSAAGQGTAAIRGAGSAAFDASGIGSGSVASTGGGNAFGAFQADATSAGAVGIAGQGAATFSVEHAAAGSVAVSGVHSAAFDLSAASFGETPNVGTASGQFTASAAARAIILEPAGLPSASRTLKLASENRTITAGSYMASWTNKDPDDVLDYAIDWSDMVGSDAIASHDWVVPDGITLDRSDLVGNVAIAWLSGGTTGRVYRLTSRITTAAGRQIDRSASLLVVPR